MGNDPRRAVAAAVAAYESGRVEEAERACRRLLENDAANVAALHLLGAIALGRGRVAEGLSAWERASALDPSDGSIANDLGAVYASLERWHDAELAFRRALAADPRLVDANSNLGNVLSERGGVAEAEIWYRRALELRPDHVPALVGLGAMLQETGRSAEAACCYRRALALDASSVQLYNNLGNVEMEAGALDEAEQYFRRALSIDPTYAIAHANLGNALKELGRLDEAAASYRRALAYKPDLLSARSNMLLALDSAEGLSPAQIYAEHREFARYCPPPARNHANSRDPERRLRIGYVSGDLRDHPVAQFLEPVLARHDPAELQVFCYSNNARADAVTQRLKARVAAWHDIFGLSDAEVFRQIGADGIDILVDLSGHTGFNRLSVFARKPAPVQVSWLGYLNTTGLDAVDYRLVDGYTAPPGLLEAYHSERLVRLPDSQWCYAPPAEAPAVSPPPLVESGYVTFASFANLAKVGDGMVNLWSRLLERVPRSRLMLVRKGADVAAADYGARFAERGISPERVAFMASRPFGEYLALHGAVDVVLDTYPYSGGTTTCHALWMGVPVVTLAGATAPSRSGASLLGVTGLGALVASSPERYIDIAAGLAGDVPRLAELRAGMRARVLASPLVDAERFARNLEAAYRGMWRDWCG
jgi:protein O-GlcNAc transferase